MTRVRSTQMCYRYPSRELTLPRIWIKTKTGPTIVISMKLASMVLSTYTINQLLILFFNTTWRHWVKMTKYIPWASSNQIMYGRQGRQWPHRKIMLPKRCQRAPRSRREVNPCSQEELDLGKKKQQSDTVRYHLHSGGISTARRGTRTGGNLTS